MAGVLGEFWCYLNCGRACEVDVSLVAAALRSLVSVAHRCLSLLYACLEYRTASPIERCAGSRTDSNVSIDRSIKKKPRKRTFPSKLSRPSISGYLGTFSWPTALTKKSEVMV